MIALLKLLLVFAGIIYLLSRRWDLGLVLVLASVVIGLLFSYPLPQIGCDALFTVVDLPTLRLAIQGNSVPNALAILGNADMLALRLALIVVLIMVLGELLRQTASTHHMVQALQELIPNGRIVIAALPALIGLLPMVGGAMFSAPMVDEVGGPLKAGRERKTFVNYWFRHIWEPIFPLHPSMLLAAELLGYTATQLARSTWPVVVTAVIGGLLFGLLGLSPHETTHSSDPSSRAQSLSTLVASIWPIVLVIVLTMILPLDEDISLVISLLVTIAGMMASKHVPLRDLEMIVRQRIPWKTVAVIFGALIFRRILENSGAVTTVSQELTDLHIPVALVAFGVPFVAGLLTGLMVAAFSIGFPVILPMVAADGGPVSPAWAVWLLVGGFVGTMLSPIHLCLGLTRVYFRAEWGPLYRLLVPSTLLVIATAAGMLLLCSS